MTYEPGWERQGDQRDPLRYKDGRPTAAGYQYPRGHDWGLESYNSQLQAVSRLLAAHSGPLFVVISIPVAGAAGGVLATTQANGLDQLDYSRQADAGVRLPSTIFSSRPGCGLRHTDASASDPSMWAALSLEESSPASDRSNERDK